MRKMLCSSLVCLFGLATLAGCGMAGGKTTSVTIKFLAQDQTPYQKVPVAVHVMDASGKEVHIEKSVTDENGIALFKNLPVGDYSLFAQNIGIKKGCSIGISLNDFTGPQKGAMAGVCIQ
ncbi:MAG TPA: hypothetical protein PLI09_22060 [Candidatus Hydrogenedentes bacterium]|nr:hypothetical protein [Candidatus Hydrogenedentota bacterium]